MESPDFFIMDDDIDLDGVITCPSSLDSLEFAESIQVEVDTDPLSFDFDLPPPSLFYPQLHSLFMKPGSGADPTLMDEMSPELKQGTKYYIKTMKPKRRPEKLLQEADSFYERQQRVGDRQHDPFFERPFSSDITNSQVCSKARKLFHCASCGKSFKFQTSLLRHNNKVHISKYACPTCQRVFSRQAYLDVHTSKLGSSCYLGHLRKTK